MDAPISLERITILDFFATFGKDLGFSNKNLHGDGNLNMSEFSTRSNLVRDTIVILLQNRFIKMNGSKVGITYAITEEGHKVSGGSTMEYGKEYLVELKNILEQTNDLTDDNIFHLLPEKIIMRIRGNK